MACVLYRTHLPISLHDVLWREIGRCDLQAVAYGHAPVSRVSLVPVNPFIKKSYPKSLSKKEDAGRVNDRRSEGTSVSGVPWLVPVELVVNS